MPIDITKTSLELLFQISRDLASYLDLQTILSRIIFLSVSNVKAERGSLIVLDENFEPVDFALMYGDKFLSHSQAQSKGLLDDGLAGWVANHREAVIVSDTQKDARWILREDDADNRSGSKSAICVPLLARDQLVGVLTIVHPVPGFFTEEHFQLIQSIADQAGIAVNNALLYESLQAAHRRYRELFESSIDPILITNCDGIVMEANRQAVKYLEQPATDLSGQSVFELHTARKELLGNGFELVHADEPVSYESKFIKPDRIEIPVEVYINPISIEGEDHLQWIFRDISERKALESLRQDLFAMIYHDLRSPLSNVVTSLNMLETLLPQESDAVLKPVMAIANRSLNRVQRLVSSLLDISRLEADQPISVMEKTPVGEILNEAVESIAHILENREQSITVDYVDPLPDTQLDRDMIKRVMINLAENATKYAPREGKIIIGARKSDGDVLYWVEDSGPGIPPEMRETIFEKFTRIESDLVPKGIGLGLAFCRLAVEAHGGKMWVGESKQLGGSCFSFTIPTGSIIN
jgi:two-component system, NtrC family, sensor histidine kinase KinB